MLNYNCPSRSSIFFSAVFIEITVLYSKANNHTGKRQLACKIAGDLFTIYDFYAVLYD